jgi:phosphoserine phosphatase RsbU/P
MNSFLTETREQISRVSSSTWRPELEKASSKYHITAAWIAVVFDPLFAITDYFNIPKHWELLLFIRLAVAAITFLTLVLRKRFALQSNIIVLIPFLLISLQNAYTFGLIDNEILLGHCLNYIALLIGGGMFILWPSIYSVVLVVLSAMATVFFVNANPLLSANSFFVNGGLLLLAVGVFMIILIKFRYDLTVKEIKARLALQESNEELAIQKSIVESKNEKITDSIRYAKRIQDSILGHQSTIDKWFKQSLVLFKPKDILSGDFYWFYRDEGADIKVIIAADCTGHGVPAAMMTVLGNSILNEVVIQKKIYEPDQILHEMDLRIIETFSRETESGHQVNDGMDVSILTFYKNQILFASAKNALHIVTNNEIRIIPGSKFPVGSTQYKEPKRFDKHIIAAAPGSKLFLQTDGYQDQFGGEKNQKFLSKNYRELLLASAQLTMRDQCKLLEDRFANWKMDSKQTDDVLIVGVQI